ncbi:4784_t:CDS:2 [Paraglomus brasilianum]|uniref:4784_t:CDS:1 n=1 Tax=Paraglomus brasilianum TaxID=144538 RepID=A0A9N9B8N5_9GLOM|nr:4784_t:CDS:2 [Paraglomus brasilianum]
MSSELYQKVYNFLTVSPLELITASSVIFQIIEEEPWISKEESRIIVNNAINASLNIYSGNTSTQNKLLRIFTQYDDAFDGICSLRDIGAVKVVEQIEANYTDLVSKLTDMLRSNPSSLYKRLLKDIKSVSISDLTWKSPLASQVISDTWEKIRKLPTKLYNEFMKPAPSFLPTEIQDECRKFVLSYLKHRIEVISNKLTHDGTWKESVDVLREVTLVIVDVLSDTWKNSAFSSEFVESISEGTYVSNVIVPAIRASLKNVPLEKSSFVSTSERQSSASADRKGKGRLGSGLI